MKLVRTNLNSKITVAAIAAAILVVGLFFWKRNFHDPLLRQELTKMAVETWDNKQEVLNHLNSIIAVNSSKLSKVQLQKLQDAKNKLGKAIAAKSDFESLNPNSTDAMLHENINDWLNNTKEAKQLITEAAGTF